MIRRATHLLALLALTGVAKAQSGDALDATLRHLAAQTEEYRRTLPNFTCVENVVSKQLHKDKLKLRIEFQATIRVSRDEKGEMKETYSMTTYMGKPLPEGRTRVPLPVYLEGGLGQGMPSFFDEKSQACYDYNLQERRVEFHAKEDSRCEKLRTTAGFATLDESGTVTRGEFKRDPAVAARNRFASLAVVDYAPVKLHGETYQLPSHLYAELADANGKDKRTFEAYYTSCRLFHATATILPGSQVVDEDGKPKEE